MRKKMLIIPGYKLYPATTGGSYYQLAYIEKQMHELDITMILTSANVSEEYFEEFCKQFPLVKVIKAGSSANGRFKKLLEGAIKIFRKSRKGNWSGKLRNIPKVSEMVIKDAQLVREIARVAESGNFDIIQTEHVINLPLISQFPPDCLKIFVQHEVFYTRARQDMERLFYNAAYTGYINEIVKGIEVSCLNNYDGIITLSEQEKSLLQEAGVTTAIQVSQCFAIKNNDLNKTFSPDMPPHLLFLGSEDHFPNKDGLTWFLQEVFPEILKQEPGVKLMVTGNWSIGFKESFKKLPVYFTGFLDSVDDLLNSSRLVAPIRIGGGIRIKIISAMTKGTPVVSTVIGAASIPHIRHGQDMFITDDAVPFANFVVELLKNPELRKQVSDNIFATAVKISNHGDFAAERNADYEYFEKIRHSKNGKLP